MKTNNYLGRQDQNRGIILFFLFLGIVIAIICGLIVANNHSKRQEEKGASSIDQMSTSIERQICDINRFELDNNRLIIEGELKENITDSVISNLQNIQIVLKDKDGDKYEFDTDYLISMEGIDFTTIIEEEEISNIDLNELQKGEYFVFLRTRSSSTRTDTGYRYRYYTLRSNAQYNELEYNNVLMKFDTSNEVSDYLTIGVN